MNRARKSRERVLGHLTELSGLPLGGGPDPAFRERLRAELAAADRAAARDTAWDAARDTARDAAWDTARDAAWGRGPLPDPAPSSPRHARPRRRHPVLARLATAGVALAMVVSTVSTYHAVPGDTLYPLKRAAESTLVRLSTDDVVRAERELVSANTRAKEVAQLLGESGGDGPLVGRTLKEMEQSTRAGITRLERAEPRSPKIEKFAEKQKDVVEPMIEKLDGDEHDQAVGYLDYIEGLVAPSQ